MHSRKRILSAILALLFAQGSVYSATVQGTPLSFAVQISPDASYLDLKSAGQMAVREASTPVRVVVTGAAAGYPHRVEVYAYVEEAITPGGKSPELSPESLRIRDAQGDWTALQPMAELEGRRGVRVAVVNGISARILLQVQLEVPAGQTPGTYRGNLILTAQEE